MWIPETRRSHGAAGARAAIAIAAIAALVAGCGGSQPPPTASTASASPKTAATQAFAFSRCMRTHGVPNFPDPVVSTSAGQQEIAVRVSPSQTSSPRFKSAQAACRHIMPAPSPTQIAQQQRHEEHGKLAFARCMRSHGVSSFPDPTPQGKITPAMASAAGVDIRSPAVLAVALKCVPASEGTVSAAEIRSVEQGSQ